MGIEKNVDQIEFYLFEAIFDSNTASKDFAQHQADQRGITLPVPIKVECLPLSSIFELYYPECAPHYLNIDVETRDFDVLSSADLSHYRPGVITCEDSEFYCDNPYSEIHRYMRFYNYRLHSCLHKTLFFVQEELWDFVKHGGALGLGILNYLRYP